MQSRPSPPHLDPIKTIGVVANPAKPRAREIVERIVRCGERLGLSVLVAPEVAPLAPALARAVVDERELGPACDLIIACGGDGTILRAARLVAESRRPILGVNLGRLGFLAELSPERLEDGLAQIAVGKYVIERRMTLEARTGESEEPLTALNDIIITKRNQSRIISLEVCEAGNWVNTYGGDGLILATPTGSTGYALSANGPIVTPEVDAIVAAPICPHSLTVRPMIFPGTVTLDVRVVDASGSTALLTADGQTPLALEQGQTARVRRGEQDAQLVHLATSSYYDILRQKLNWGMDKAQQLSSCQ